MGLLAGNFECTIDGKNRLLIPADFRREVDTPGQTLRWFAVLYLGRRLQLMPEAEFESLVNQFDRSPLADPDEREFAESLLDNSFRVEPDKQGRVVLPERLIRDADLGKQVILVGRGHSIAIYSPEQWEVQRKKNLDELHARALAARSNRRPDASK